MRKEGTPLEGTDVQPHKEEGLKFSVSSHLLPLKNTRLNHRCHEVTEGDHDNLCGHGHDGKRFSAILEELVEDNDDDNCHYMCLVKRERALPSFEIPIHIHTLALSWFFFSLSKYISWNSETAVRRLQFRREFSSVFYPFTFWRTEFGVKIGIGDNGCSDVLELWYTLRELEVVVNSLGRRRSRLVEGK